MRRILLAALALAMVTGFALAPARNAHADDWCWGDPIVMIGGKTVNINVGVQGTSSQVAGHVSHALTVVYVPQGVSHSIVGYTPAPFEEKAVIIPVSWLAATATEINVKVEVWMLRKTTGSRSAGVMVTQNGVTIGQQYGRTDMKIAESFKVRR
jgi:hypothetical protein